VDVPATSGGFVGLARTTTSQYVTLCELPEWLNWPTVPSGNYREASVSACSLLAPWPRARQCYCLTSLSPVSICPTQEQLTELFIELSGAGTTLVMTTHDLAQAMATADRVCLVNRTVIADSTPQQLRDPAMWMQTFGISGSSPLLRIVGADAA